jgi:hypothetical protein
MVSTIDQPHTELPHDVTVEDYSLSLEGNGQSIELPFKPKTPIDVGSVAIKEIIHFDTASPEQGEGSRFVEKPGDDTATVPLESPAGVEIDDEKAEILSGFRRESTEGRHGPEYNNKGETHTDQESIARYQDWVRGTGRMLDVAWDEGAITDENMQEWIAFKQAVEKFHGISDFYALSDIGKLRGEVFQFVKRLGVADKAYAAYDAETE